MKAWHELTTDEKIERLAAHVYALERRKMDEPPQAIPGYEILSLSHNDSPLFWDQYLGVFGNKLAQIENT